MALAASLTQHLPNRWLLLRGLGREQGHWFDFPTRLSERFGLPVSCLDLPGFGSESGRRVPWSIEGMARDVERRLVHGREHGSLGVIAISLGSMVALALGERRPDVARLVLINASSRLSPPWQRLSPKAAAGLVRAALERDVFTRQLALYQLTTNSTGGAVEQWARRAALLERQRPPRAGAVLRQLLAAARFRTPRMQRPSLVLSSRCDRLVSSECSKRLAEFLHAPHKEHPSAGHDLPLEDPDWVLEQVAEWLSAA